MKNTHRYYESPLVTRYASGKMSSLFSQQNQFKTWRAIWVALAQSQQEVGLPITNEQIDQLLSSVDDIDFERIREYEIKFKHDVMANIHAYGDMCPDARSIIHLGATSCTITDNADLIIMRNALLLIKNNLIVLLKHLSLLAEKYKEVPCLGFTHGQVAQPTTIGKRIAGWLQDFLFDFNRLEFQLNNLYFLGIKGATGTQASFLQLVDGDHDKVCKLEQLVAEKLGFDQVISISGQTYTRKQDVYILNLLSDIAISAHKMANDIRLLASKKEMQEPFGSSQVGSSAMPYKKNPMKCERICSLARFVMNAAENPKYTASIQWFERTLDDSANRRLCIPETFLAVDGILRLVISVSKGLVVHESHVGRNLNFELPFLAAEYILMSCVKKGGDRQKIHEYIREHSMKASHEVDTTGINDLFERIVKDDRIDISEHELSKIDASLFIGRAPQQVENFLNQEVWPMLQKHVSVLDEVEEPLI